MHKSASVASNVEMITIIILLFFHLILCKMSSIDVTFGSFGQFAHNKNRMLIYCFEHTNGYSLGSMCGKSI